MIISFFLSLCLTALSLTFEIAVIVLLGKMYIRSSKGEIFVPNLTFIVLILTLFSFNSVFLCCMFKFTSELFWQVCAATAIY